MVKLTDFGLESLRKGDMFEGSDANLAFKSMFINSGKKFNESLFDKFSNMVSSSSPR